MNTEQLTIKDLLNQLEYSILAEHQLFLDGKYNEAAEYKNKVYNLKKEITNRVVH